VKVLIACEFSGTVRDAFAAHGHDAWSCDLVPSETPGNHIVGSVLDQRIVNEGWDLMIAHPECTYLTVSANAWASQEWRVEARLAAMHFVRALWAFPIPKVCIENPVGVLGTFWRKASQIIQPHEFGDDASKSTCLWLRGLPLLRPTVHCPPRIVNGKKRWANQTDSGQNNLGPSDDRQKERARTYAGIALAMAEQWGNPDLAQQEAP
jgi:hypothetical protein